MQILGKIEENPKGESKLSPEEQSVVQHFKDNHCHTETGRFIVPLPKMSNKLVSLTVRL